MFKPPLIHANLAIKKKSLKSDYLTRSDFSKHIPTEQRILGRNRKKPAVSPPPSYKYSRIPSDIYLILTWIKIQCYC